MIRDYYGQLTTTVAFDLEAVSPGPGEPIKLMAIGVSGSVVVTTCATTGGSYTALTTVLGPAGVLEFELPSNTLQFIKATFSAGTVEVALPGVQTAV
jgi:hypothetical protein